MEQEIIIPSDPGVTLHYTTYAFKMYFGSQVSISCKDCGPVSGLKPKGLAASIFTYPREVFGSRHLKGSIQQQYSFENTYARKNCSNTEAEISPIEING